MVPTDRQSFIEIVLGFAELKGKKLSLPAVELYWNAMQDWSLDDFRAAANRLLKTCEFMPTPKDFEDLRKAGKETAAEVFANLDRWFKYTPNGYLVKEGTPRAIESAIRAMGGADAYMLGETSKRPFMERRFCEHYDTISEAQETRQTLPQLTLGSGRQAVAGSFKRLGA